MGAGRSTTRENDFYSKPPGGVEWIQRPPAGRGQRLVSINTCVLCFLGHETLKNVNFT